MSNEFYDDLSQALHKSLSQALNIAKGETEPSRVFSYEMPAGATITLMRLLEKQPDLIALA